MGALCVIASFVAPAITQGSRVLPREHLITEEPRTLVDVAAIVRDLAPFNEPAFTLGDEKTRLGALLRWTQMTAGEICGPASRTISIRPRLRYPRVEVWEALLMKENGRERTRIT